MMKWLYVLCHCFVVCGYAAISDYSQFESSDAVIAYETSWIETPQSFEDLVDAYASRGESFLLTDRYSEALTDLQQAYFLSLCIEDEEVVKAIKFRVLFDLMFVHAYLDHPKMVAAIATVINRGFNDSSCCCEKTITSNTLNAICPCSNDTPIYGPDQISIRDCIDFVNNTVALSNLLISKSPTSVRALLNVIITQLADQARYCCRQGKGWKGCVQKLCNKYHQWNQKWQVFGIPPDPAWD